MLRPPILFSALFLALSYSLAEAGRTYTATELRNRVQSGRYPDQGEVESTVVSRSFGACILGLEEMISAVRPNYPVVPIAVTSILRTEKIWTNDAAMTITCSALDNKMIITTSPYR